MRMTLFVMLVAAWLAGCGGHGVQGHIPPSTFKFTTVVSYDGEGTGGWKIAQVMVLLARISAALPAKNACHVEVGVPEVNFKGPVSNIHAQQQSARAADSAARQVLSQRMPSALLCERFRVAMERVLERLVPGAKVGDFTRFDVPRTTFPKKRR